MPQNLCHNGCGFHQFLGVVGGSYYEPTGGTCTVTNDTPSPTNVDNDNCTEDYAPLDPASCGTADPEHPDSDQDGKPDSEDPYPDDPTDGQDESDEGDESDNFSSGGGSCAAAPSCSGDSIQCNVLYQTWRTRCAAEGIQTNTAGGTGGGDTTNNNTTNNITNNYGDEGEPEDPASVGGGDIACVHSYSVTGGEPVNVAHLVEAQRQRCAEKTRWEDAEGPAYGRLPDGYGEGAGGDGECEPGEPCTPHHNVSLGVGMLDEGGLFGGTRSCTPLGSVDLGMFGSFDFDSLPYFCDFQNLVRGILILMGAFIAFRILAGDNS